MSYFRAEPGRLDGRSGRPAGGSDPTRGVYKTIGVLAAALRFLLEA